MRYVTPHLLLTGLLAGNLLAAATLLSGPALASDGLKLASATRRAPVEASEAAEPGGPLRSAERARYCAQTYPADFYDGWVKNSCSKAPYGVKFEYLTSAWRCLCLGHQ